MFVLSGYDAFLGFLLLSAAVPVLALVANKRIKNVRAHHVYGSLTYKGLDYAP